MRRLLVVSSVHPPDDPRIREKTVGSLVGEWDVTYATKTPGPRKIEGLSWRPLRGGRIARSLAASALLVSGRWDVASVHDPELLPAAMVRSILGRDTVFDLHEDVPAQIRNKTGVPGFLRPALAFILRWLLRLADGMMTVTVAEPDYARLLPSTPEVIPNHLLVERLPQPAADGKKVVYLGDISTIRGATSAVAFARGARLRLQMIGRCPPRLREQLEAQAGSEVTIEFTGHLDHRAALAEIATATVGLSPLHAVPNYVRSLPTKVLEYLALGLGAVVSDLEGTRSVIGDLPGVVLLPPGDDQAWEEAGRDLDLTELRSQAEKGVDAVRERFAWPADRVRAVYRRAADG